MIRNVFVIALWLAGVGTAALIPTSYTWRPVDLSNVLWSTYSIWPHVNDPSALSVSGRVSSPGLLTAIPFSDDRGVLVGLSEGRFTAAYAGPVETAPHGLNPRAIGADSRTFSLRFWNFEVYRDVRVLWDRIPGQFGRRLVVCIPLWLLAVLFGAYPAVSFVRGPLRRAVTRNRRRVHRVGLAGFVLSGIVAFLFVTSLRWTFGYSGGSGARTISFIGGSCVVEEVPLSEIRFLGLFCDSHVEAYTLRWWPRSSQRVTRLFAGATSTTKQFALPLWIPFVAILLPSLLFWRIGHIARPKELCLECGYNLTGNVSGVCPECGVKIG